MSPPKKKNFFLPKVLNRPNGPACQIWQKKNKKMTHPKIFFAKNLISAKWTCLPNMVSLAQWEQVSHHSYYSYSSSYYYTLKIRANEPARLRNIEPTLCTYASCRLKMGGHNQQLSLTVPVLLLHT